MYKKIFAFFILVLTHAKLSDGFPSEINLRQDDQINEHLRVMNSKWSVRNVSSNNPYEHDAQGDITGIGGHVVQQSDGTSHYQVNLWPNGVVPYTIIAKGSYQVTYVEPIRSVISYLEKETCLRFKVRDREKNYIEFNLIDENRCNSEVGMSDLKTKQLIRLNKERCINRRSISHEIMHALGFIHEHARPDRNKYVIFHPENLRVPAEASEFKIRSDLFINLGVPYDLDSIVHYSKSHGAIPDRAPLVARNGRIDFGQSPTFSKVDLIKLNRAYKCKNRRSGRGRK